MALDPNKWTLKTQEAFSAAVEQAKALNNPEVTTDHLLAALLRQTEGGITLPILDKVGVDSRSSAQRRRRGGGQAAQGLRRLRTPAVARPPVGDDGRRRGPHRTRRRVPVGRAPAAGPGRRASDVGQGGPARTPCARCGAATGSPARTPRTSTRRSRSTAATSPRRPAPASSTRSSGATRRSAGSSRCCRRRTKNNPVLIGEPGVGKTAIVEGLARRIVDGDVPESLKDKRLVSLDIGAMVAGRQVPRRVRGAAQGGAQGDHRLRRPGHHLHRRDAHRRRRRRGRGLHWMPATCSSRCWPAASCA